jgi:phage/plasmid-associated DNA primase
VANVEVEDGRRFAESLVKQLTGGDKIKARFMRMDFFEFPPTHKVFLSANHKPVVRGTDYAMWRRIKLIPFDVTIPDSEKDKRLPKKLSAELPGILAWAVRGCLDWQREGLYEPPEVTNATEEYRADMDVLAQFIDECCVVMPHVSVQATRLYEAYKDWAESNGEFVERQKKFGMRLSERGFVRQKTGVYYWLGIGLSHKGPESGPSGGKGPESKTTGFAGKPQKDSEPPGPSGPKSSMNTRKSPHAGVMPELGPDGPDGPDGDLPTELWQERQQNLEYAFEKCHHSVTGGCHLCHDQGRWPPTVEGVSK